MARNTSRAIPHPPRSALTEPRPIVVTGVSTGIGRAIAQSLVAAGHPVFGSVRTAEDAAAFEVQLGPAAKALVFDVRDEAAIRAAAESLEPTVGTTGIAGLVNNAGIAIAGPLEDLPLGRLREQIEINLIGTLAVTQAFLPLLKTGAPGRIVNISSVSGLVAFPFMGPYAASKFALEALSDSLRLELGVHGIRVIVVEPGGIATPIWTKAEEEAAAGIGAYDGSPYQAGLAQIRGFAGAVAREGLAPDSVARVVLAALKARRPRVRYAVSRSPMQDRLMRMMPTRLLDRIVTRRLGLNRRR